VTGDAAEKVLDAVDRARVVQHDLTQQASGLNQRWNALAASLRDGERELVEQTCDFLRRVGGQADQTNAILTDIMMAQDFHDLTGQVIRKVVALAATLEEQLVKLLIETTPPEQRRRPDSERLDGPVVNAAGRDDVVADQAQVDDLLASLGF
jgi:chemotaxis protein CheZ